MEVTRGNRLHIGFYGKRNVGKSTLFNLILGQNYSITSEVLGTTTDVNQKSMELLPIGPVNLMDCAGIDDNDNEKLGQERVEKTNKTLNRVDVAVFICDYSGLDSCDIDFLNKLFKLKIPVIIVVNKTDLGEISKEKFDEIKKYSKNLIKTSCIEKDRNGFVEIFKKELEQVLPKNFNSDTSLLPDFLNKGDIAVLVVPIDTEAPAGRLILPQVQMIRDLLDKFCISVICQENELQQALEALKVQPKIVITDSQAFKKVSEIVPENILLTSFSTLFANLKGDLRAFVDGAKKLENLEDNDKILICESCTHHATEDDIGRVKIPDLVKKFSGKNLIFEHYSGFDFPKNIENYKLIIHCGACMTNKTEILRRIETAKQKNVPITNYGVAIAKCLGILNRAIELFE